MGSDAPAQSLDAWIDFIGQVDKEEKNRRRVVSLMFKSLMLDPHFLLSK